MPTLSPLPPQFGQKAIAKRFHSAARGAQDTGVATMSAEDRMELRKNKSVLFFEQLAGALDTNRLAEVQLLRDIRKGEVIIDRVAGEAIWDTERAVIRIDGKKYLLQRFKTDSGDYEYWLEHRYGRRSLGSLGQKFMCKNIIRLQADGSASYHDGPDYQWAKGWNTPLNYELTRATRGNLDLTDPHSCGGWRAPNVHAHISENAWVDLSTEDAPEAMRAFFEQLGEEVFSPERRALEEAESLDNQRMALDAYLPEKDVR